MSVSLLPANGGFLVTTDAIGAALGTSSSASTLTTTLISPSMALGAAGAEATAQNIDGTLPDTTAATASMVAGGDTLWGESTTMTNDFSIGSTALSGSSSSTFFGALSPIA
jgi:hypothetical protein